MPFLLERLDEAWDHAEASTRPSAVSWASVYSARTCNISCKGIRRSSTWRGRISSAHSSTCEQRRTSLQSGTGNGQRTSSTGSLFPQIEPDSLSQYVFDGPNAHEDEASYHAREEMERLGMISP